jgi:hypothetical protein
MALYFHIQDSQVPSGDPVPLPLNWEHVSSLDALEPKDLAKLGWKPAVDQPPDFDPEWEICRRTGWTVKSDKVVAEYVIEPISLDQIKAAARARAALRRWQAEIDGIEVMGVRVDTGRESQAMLAGANLLATMYPDMTIDWKTDDGWVQLSAAQIIGLSSAVGLHVQACFTRERMISELIDAADNPAAVRRAEAW